ncbi:MAG TPA: hypothetical protein VFF06_04465 [Polyangia bacterium]|nr:hypothetical protein [Polyangia bacterium]
MPIVALALVAALAGGCSAPEYGDGHLRCATSGRACPDNFFCASDQHCWRLGSGPGDGGAAGPSLCAPGLALLCDGFEAAALDPQWTPDGATLDTTRAYRGSSSVHLHTAAAGAGTDPSADLRESRTFPITGTAYVRLWTYFQSPFPPAFDQIINFLDTGSGGASFSIKNGFAVDNDYAGSGYAESTTVSVPLDRWTCLQMQIGQRGATGDIRLFVDGQEAADAALTGTTTTPMRAVVLGPDFFGNPAIGAADVWIDEVIVDDKPTTCAE